jgi:hypothetical protein
VTCITSTDIRVSAVGTRPSGSTGIVLCLPFATYNIHQMDPANTVYMPPMHNRFIYIYLLSLFIHHHHHMYSIDPVSGACYYENTITGETQWETPFDFIPVVSGALVLTFLFTLPLVNINILFHLALFFFFCRETTTHHTKLIICYHHHHHHHHHMSSIIIGEGGGLLHARS